MTSPPRARPAPGRPPRVAATLVALAALALLVATCGVLRRVVPDSRIPINESWAAGMTRIRSAPLTRLAEVLDVVGGGAVNVIVVVVAVVVVLVVAGPWRAALTGAAALLEAGLVSALKAFSAQPRPSGHLVAVSGAAFPSGHASSAAFLAVSLALLAPRVWTWAIAVGWMLAMDLSRTYLSVHWLVDVVGGSLLGAALATLAWALAPRTSSAPTATG